MQGVGNCTLIASWYVSLGSTYFVMALLMAIASKGDASSERRDATKSSGAAALSALASVPPGASTRAARQAPRRRGSSASVCRSHAKARPIGAETDRRLCLDCDTREYADFMLTRAQAWPAVYGEGFHSIY